MIERFLGAPSLGIAVLADRVAVAVARGGRITDGFAIVDAEHPAESLRGELEARGLKPRSARLGLQRSFAVVKPVELPATVNDDLGQMVQFELERHVPFPAEDAAFDFVPLPPAGDGQRVLVVACERRAVDQALRVLGEVKLRPASLTVAAHDLVWLLGRRPPGERAVWVHRVGASADLLLLAGNALVGSRSIAADDPAALAAEIRGSLAMLRWPDCDAVWVSGDNAFAVQGSPALGALGVPVGPPPLSPRAERALGALGEPADGAALLAAAVALGPPARRPDLLPAALRPRHLRRDQKLTVATVALTVLLGLGALLGQGIRAQRELGRLDAEIRRLDPQVRAIQRVMDAVERERRILATVQAVSAASLRPLPLLRELTETLPPDAWLTTLTLDQKGAEMTGQASTASALIPLLENSPRLEHVEFASPVTRGRDREQFRIRASWELPPGSEGPAGASPAARGPSPRATALRPPPAGPSAAAPSITEPRPPEAR